MSSHILSLFRLIGRGILRAVDALHPTYREPNAPQTYSPQDLVAMSEYYTARARPRQEEAMRNAPPCFVYFAAPRHSTENGPFQVAYCSMTGEPCERKCSFLSNRSNA